MRVLGLVPVHPDNLQLRQGSNCAVCNTNYMFFDGVLARIEHATGKMLCDDGEKCMDLRSGVCAYHSLQCFLAIADAEGNA
jgi:hypothetical protein